MKDLWKAIDHNRWLAFALTCALVLTIVFIGCAPKTGSIITPGKTVTQAELESEALGVESDYDAAIAKLKVARSDLAAKYAARRKVVEVVGALGTAAAGGTVNPLVGIAALIQLATVGAAAGAIVDNRRKDKVIKAKTAKKA